MIVVGATMWLGLVLGFSTPASFAQPAHEGGGGGRYFTGSAHDGFSCDVCHDGGDSPALDLEGAPAIYTPGKTYTLSLAWPEPHLAMVGEIVDDDGHGFGTLTLPPDSVLEEHERCAGGLRAVRPMDVGTEERVVFAVPDCGSSLLRVQWTAPEGATSALHVHLAAVAADGEGDIENDGAARVHLEIPSSLAPEPSGCRIADDTSCGAWWSLLVLGWRRRRR